MSLGIRSFAALEWPLDDTPRDTRAALREAGLKAPRRSSRFSQLALLGASALAVRPEPDCGVYLGTALGSSADTVTMLEAVQRGEAPMPFPFINVSGSLAGFGIAQSLGLLGPNLTISRRDFPVEVALETALKDHGRPPQALVGAVEEGVWPLAAQRRRLRVPPEAALGECSHWFLLDDTLTEGPRLEWVAYFAHPEKARAALAGLRMAGAVRLVLASEAARDAAAGWREAVPGAVEWALPARPHCPTAVAGNLTDYLADEAAEPWLVQVNQAAGGGVYLTVLSA
ncbi:hypothetical protein [Alkalilimnicola sp. S0819]|uniref:hypothetical protein n=1 Tax=Alkalilimnicola sp. S0819 TaxID=2613922 RepID=UPI00126284DB|nr:hypothetical protein [Alkalilimnicola sp. S0819]KAB7624170.1 hypothetical protein F3N43_07210 [Alkalilimnicola sp. S0819]MPQ16423.1 hypothetical protein [Alkalilimnicola sp. S0819]